MAWTAAEKTIYKLLQIHYGPGMTSPAYERLAGFGFRKGNAALPGAIAGHGVAAFFYHALTAGVLATELPGDVLQGLKKAAGRTALINAVFIREGAELCRELNRLGVEYLLLKGFAHLEKVYGSLHIRPVSDLDLLIRKKDYPQVRAILLSRGFSPFIDPGFGGTEREWAAIKDEYHTEMHFLRSLGGFTTNVDIHWDLLNLIQRGSPLETIYPVNDVPWFEHRDRIYLEKVPVPCLSLEMHFLHAVYHFALGHKFAGVKWFVDLCQFDAVLGKRLNWAFIYTMAAQYHCLKLLALARALVSAVTGARYWPVEAGGIRLPVDKINPLELRFYRQRLFAGPSHTGIYLSLALLPRRWKERWRVLSFILFNREAFPHWRTGKRKIIPGLQPFSLVLKALQEQAGRLFKS